MNRLIYSITIILAILFGNTIYDHFIGPEVLIKEIPYGEHATIVLRQQEEINRKKENIQDLKNIVETKEFATEMFKDTPPENIYFGNLVVHSDFFDIRNSLFICIGDFGYGIYLDGSNASISEIGIESR